ncbi:MAG: hypothetical protein ABSA53_38095, partial [Streptosporangiaceae bacterium]
MPEGWRELPPSRADWLTEDEWVEWLSGIEPEEWAGPGEDPGDDPGAPPAAAPGATAKPRPGAKGAHLPSGVARGSRGGRRGPGQPGSAGPVPGASPGPAGTFAAGHPLDTAP